MAYRVSNIDIANALGVTPGRVSQLRADGMPAESIEQALAWYRRRVSPARAAGQRLARRWRPGAAPAGGGEARQRVEALGRWAMSALVAGRFYEAEADLRAALAAVPLEDRLTVELDREVWGALTADVLQAVRDALRDEPSAEPPSNVDVDEFMGHFWFAAAAGEIVTVERSAVPGPETRPSTSESRS